MDNSLFYYSTAELDYRRERASKAQRPRRRRRRGTSSGRPRNGADWPWR